MKTKFSKIATNNKLQEVVKNIIIQEAEHIENYLSDVLNYGCISGVVSALIYYCDTTSFFNNNKEDIKALLKDTLYQFGAKCPTEVFGKQYDTDDIFCEDTNNQNLLAWFAFEETCRQFADKLGIEL